MSGRLPGTLPVMEVIEVEPRYRRLAEHLLGNVVIAENDQVLEMTSHQVVIEKTGKYVKGRYTLTGGSVGLFEGKKIGRAKNLEKLQQEITAQEAVVDLLKEQISKKQAEVLGYNEHLKDKAIRQTEQEILQLTNAVFAAQNKIENLQHLQQTALGRLEQLQDQKAEQDELLADVREQLADFTERLQNLQDTLADKEAAYKAAEAAYQQAAGQYNEGNLAFTRAQSKLATLEQEVRFKHQQVTNLQQQMEVSKLQLFAIADELVQNEATLNQNSTLLEQLMRQKEEDERALNEADRAYYAHRNSLQNRESALRLKIKAKEQADHLLENIKDNLNDLKLQLAGIKERLQVEFKINIEDILDEPRETDTPAEELQAAATA